MGYAKRKNSLYSACTTRAAKIWRLLSVWPFSSFPPKSVFLVGVAGKGRMMDRQSATKQLSSTSCEQISSALFEVIEVKRGHWIKKWEFESELNQIIAFILKTNMRDNQVLVSSSELNGLSRQGCLLYSQRASMQTMQWHIPRLGVLVVKCSSCSTAFL